MKNFQDVIRDVYNEPAHALQTTGSAAATIFAVVNTGAASDSTLNIGFATVAVSTPTLYAVVNTGAAGVGNSIVTVANPNVGILGNVTLSDSKNYIGLVTSTIGNSPVLGNGVGSIGFATVAVSTPTLYAVVNTSAPGITNSIVTVANTVPVTFSGNVTLTDPKTYIGSVSVSGTVGLGTSTLNVGSVSVLGGTIAVSSLPALVASTVNIGSVSILGGKIINDTSTLNIGSVSVLGGVINTNINAGVTNIGFATVSVSNPTLYAVVNTGAAGVGNSIVTVANPNFGINAGVNGIGFATVNLVNQPALVASTVNIGSVSVLGGTIAVSSLPALAASSAFVGLVTVANTVTVGAHALSAGVANIGFMTISNALAWPDPKTYIGLVTVGHTVTVAAHAGSFYPAMCVMAFSGSLASPLDQQNGSNSTPAVTTLSSGSVTPGDDNQLIICALEVNFNTTGSIDSGFTGIEFAPANSGTSFGNGLGYIIETTAAAKNPAWSWTTLSSAAVSIATFKAAPVIVGKKFMTTNTRFF